MFESISKFSEVQVRLKQVGLNNQQTNKQPLTWFAVNPSAYPQTAINSAIAIETMNIELNCVALRESVLRCYQGHR